MKKLFKRLISVLLVVSMLTVTEMQALADGTGDPLYVSEIKMATCNSLEDAKKELDGYTVVESNINEGMTNGAQQVYMGYKTTQNKDEAITDLRLMDMNGGYSYCDYDKVLATRLSTIKTEIDSFLDAVKEFQKNYAAGLANAKYAYKLMNQFKDDDQQDKLMGDIFLDKTISADKLATIFLQGNSMSVSSIEQALAIGCADDWLSRLVQNGRKPYGVDGAMLDDYCEIIRLQWDELYTNLYLYEEQLEANNGYDMSEYSAETFEEWVKAYTPSEEMQACVFNYGTVYHILDDIRYKTGTLLEYFMVPKDEIDYSYLYPMADAMTIGQIQTLCFVNLNKAISFSQIDYSEWAPAIEGAQDELAAINQKAIQKAFGDAVEVDLMNASEVASVYEGVDRSLFTAGSGVALTNDALRKSATSEDKCAVAQVFNNCKISLPICAAVGIGLVVAAAVKISKAYDIAATAEMKLNLVMSSAKESLVNTTYAESAASLRTAQAGFDSAKNIVAGSYWMMGIAIGILLISVGLSIYIGYHQYMNPDYKTVPRAIVEEKEVKIYNSYNEEVGTKKYYYAYYPVEDAVADKENGKYADMNAWKAQQWNVMYYTTDKNAGQPILADTFVVQVGNNKRPEDYTAFSEFGMDVAADVNKHAFKEIPGIYIFYKTASAGANSYGTASVITGGYYALSAAAGLVVGAFSMFGVGTMLNKRRRKSAPVGAEVSREK